MTPGGWPGRNKKGGERYQRGHKVREGKGQEQRGKREKEMTTLRWKCTLVRLLILNLFHVYLRYTFTVCGGFEQKAASVVPCSRDPWLLSVQFIAAYVPRYHYRFVSTKTLARNRIGDGYRAPVLSFGTAESVSNQVKSWHKQPPPPPQASNAIGCAEALLTAKNYGFSFTGFGYPVEAQRTNNTLVQSHENSALTASHTHQLTSSLRAASHIPLVNLPVKRGL